MFTPKRVFVPRNINKRDKELELIKDEKIKNFKLFLSEFKYNLKAIKNQKSDDYLEQSFIDLINNCDIKLYLYPEKNFLGYI
jgi:hypothetical protein